jgi:hypothetical protein
MRRAKAARVLRRQSKTSREGGGLQRKRILAKVYGRRSVVKSLPFAAIGTTGAGLGTRAIWRASRPSARASAGKALTVNVRTWI